MSFCNKIKILNKKLKQKLKSQTGYNYPHPQSQSIFMELAKYSRKISPLTAEVLKIISLTTILLIGLGFLDLLIYTQKIGIVFPQSFLSSQNLIVLIMIPVLITLLVLILPFFVAIIVYSMLNDESYNQYFKIILALVYSLSLIYFPYLFFHVSNNVIWYIILLYIAIVIIYYLYLKKIRKNELIKNNEVSSFLIILSFIFAYAIILVDNNKANYLFAVLSAIYFLFAVMPFSLYIPKHFDKSLSYNKGRIILLSLFILPLLVFVAYFIISKSSLPFRVLKIGGNIQVKLLVPQKYFNELIVKNKASKESNKPNKNNLSKQKNLYYPKNNNFKWHQFELLLKTPDNYYVEYVKNKKEFSIPIKYIHSEKIITLANKNKSLSQKHNNKIKTKENNNKLNKSVMTMQNQTYSFNVPPWILSLIASVVGGLITGLFMMWQNKKNYKYNLKLIEQEDEKIEKAVLQAIETEIKVIWERYENFIKPSIEELVKSDYSKKFTDMNKYMEDLNYFHVLLSYRVSISQDYFTIYNGNSSFIGKIKNEKLRKEIVSVYTNIKGFIELISLINKNQDKIEKVLKDDLEFARTLMPKNIEAAANVMMSAYKARLNNVVEYLKQLKKQQDDLDIQIKNLLQSLDKEIKI